MIFLLTNVAKTQDVLLDGTIFFGDTLPSPCAASFQALSVNAFR